MASLGLLEELAPMKVGAEALALTIADPTLAPRAFRAVDLDVSYTGAGADGVVLPLELLVQGPSPSSFRRHVFRRFVPSRVSFTPREGGQFLVLLREVGHDLLVGRIIITVDGDRTDQP